MKKTVGEMVVEYLKKNRDHTEKIEGLASVLDNVLEKDENTDVKYDMISEVEDYTVEYDEDTIKNIVSSLKRRDGGISGEHWNIEETSNVAKQYDVENKVKELGKTYCDLKFWFAMNYVFAVHYSITRTMNGFVELAIDEITNKNICFDNIIKQIFEKM